MAFENSSKIADIMMGSMGKFPSAIGGLSQGYQQGLANRQQREQMAQNSELMGMKRKQFTREEAEQLAEDIGGKAAAIYMMPKEARPAAWDQFRSSVSTKFGKDPGPYSEESLVDIMSDSKIGQQQLVSEQQHQRQQGAFGKPFEAINAQGQRVFVERAPDGSMREIEGYNAPVAASLLGRPSAVQEYEYFSALPPEQQAAYLNVKRSNAPLNTGSAYVPYDPVTQQPANVAPIPINLKPGEEPAVKGEQAEQSAIGAAVGKAQGEAIVDLPKFQAQSRQMLGLLNQIKEHPALSDSVGLYSVLPIIPGTPRADFDALLKQVQGKQFLQAFQSLKGGGQITEIEGQKATEAESRMRTATSEQAFRAAVVEYADEVSNLIQLANQRAMAATQNRQQRQPVAPQPGQQQAPQSPEYTNFGPRQGAAPRFLGFE